MAQARNQKVSPASSAYPLHIPCPVPALGLQWPAAAAGGLSPFSVGGGGSGGSACVENVGPVSVPFPSASVENDAK